VNPKINHRNLPVQNEGADNQYNDGFHGCEFRSKNDNFGSVFKISEEIRNFIYKNNKIGNEKY
jgi:hypothetical protein